MLAESVYGVKRSHGCMTLCDAAVPDAPPATLWPRCFDLPTIRQLRSAINRLTSAPAPYRSPGSEVTVAVKIDIDLCRHAVYNRVHTPPAAGRMRRLENPLMGRRVVHGGTLPMAQGRCFPHSVLGLYRPRDLCPRAEAPLLRTVMGLCRARSRAPGRGRLQAHRHRLEVRGNYAAFETLREELTRVFSVGRCHDKLVDVSGSLKFAE
jgi:hypothetical protein